MHPSNRGQGKAFAWLEAHKEYPHKEWCLVWPFYRNRHGQGSLGYMGKNYWAHRLMCTLVHGEPSTPDLIACHDCGNGHEGCVNPHHIQWKTISENAIDRTMHNGILVRHRTGTSRRLTTDQVKAIRSTRGFRTRQEVAAQFGISERAVGSIWNGHTFQSDAKISKWTAEEDQLLREAVEQKMSFSAFAGRVNRTPAAVQAHAARLGLSSGYEQNKPRNPPSSFLE